MKIQLAAKPLNEIKSEYIVVAKFDEQSISEKLPLIADFERDNPKFGKLYETAQIYHPEQKIILVGAGKKDQFDIAKLQNWFGTAAKHLLNKTKLATIIVPLLDQFEAEQITQASAIGIQIASFNPTPELKSDKDESKLATIELVISKATNGYQQGLKQGLIMADGINLIRRLGDLPPNIMTPTFFLSEAKKVAKESKLKITILTETLAKKKGMGAFIGVAQGSDEPSYMIALEYTGDIRNKEKWGLVGKGITLDTGGLSIKPASSIPEMKYDMLGAATALAAISVLAKLGVKKNIVAVMAVTENMPSGKAMRPSDVIKSYSGKTIEIQNTDAEGRLVLIDGMTYAQRDFKANKIIDIATLTGAMVVALGDLITGVFSNNDDFTKQLLKASAEVGERMYPLPMDEEFAEYLKSDFADIQNSGGGSMGHRTAGSITAAKFLEKAVENNNPWIHLDIAGTAWDLKSKPYRPIGATGVALKTLVKLII